MRATKQIKKEKNNNLSKLIKDILKDATIRIAIAVLNELAIRDQKIKSVSGLGPHLNKSKKLPSEFLVETTIREMNNMDEEFYVEEDEQYMNLAIEENYECIDQSWEIPPHVRDILDELYADEDAFDSALVEIEDDLRATIDWDCK